MMKRKKPVIITNPSNVIQKNSCVKGSASCLPVRLLNTGKTAPAIAMAIMVERIVSKMASPINCFINTMRNAPITFLTPTSFARLTDRAVARFIKLMQAISKIKTAIMVKRRTYSILPPSILPSLNVECRYFSV